MRVKQQHFRQGKRSRSYADARLAGSLDGRGGESGDFRWRVALSGSSGVGGAGQTLLLRGKSCLFGDFR